MGIALGYLVYGKGFKVGLHLLYLAQILVHSLIFSFKSSLDLPHYQPWIT